MKKINFAKILIYGATGITLFIVFGILAYILLRGIVHINLEFLIGLLPYIVTTLMLVAISVVIAVPVGICAAIYLNEYAKKSKFVETIRFSIECLASIPSIVYGLFGMLVFVNLMGFGFSIIAGALTLSILVLPLVIRTTEESLKTIPNSYREGSLALGANKFRTTIRVVVPAAVPGILTGVILTIGRIVGESAPVYMTVGTAPYMPTSIYSSGQTLSVHMYLLAKEGISYDEAYATAAVLIIIVLGINFLASGLAKRIGRIEK